jgi:hypothetical protein
MRPEKFTNLYLTGLAHNGNYADVQKVIKKTNAPLGDFGKKQFHCCEAFRAMVRMQSRGAPPPSSLPRSRRGASQHFYLPVSRA